METKVIQVTIDKKELDKGNLKVRVDKRDTSAGIDGISFIDFNTGFTQTIPNAKEFTIDEYNQRITANQVVIGEYDITKVKNYLVWQMLVVQNNQAEYEIKKLEAMKKEQNRMSKIYKNLINNLDLGDE